MTMKTRQLKTYGFQQKQSQEGSLEQCNPTSGKHRIENLTLHLKNWKKKKKNNNKISRRKEIIKIQAEINEKEMKETIVETIKLKAGSLRT